MKKLVMDLAILVFMVLAAVVFYVYVPRSAVNLHRRIAATSPGELNEERRALSAELEQYLADGLPRDPGQTASLLHLYLANQRKFFDLRFKQAITEVEISEVGQGRARVWSFMNMGVVVKTQNKLMAFDIADMPESVVQKRLAGMADIFLVTHADMDHYDSTLLKKALRQGKAVVFPENFRFMYEDQGFSRIYKLKDGEVVDIDGVKVTAFQTDHRSDGNFGVPNAWYLVDADGLKLLHTGDGWNFKDRNKKKKLANSGVDVFLGNIKIHPYDIRDVKPKTLVPLHLFKFMRREELENSTFSEAEKIYSQYEKELKGINIEFLFPGESFELPVMEK